MKAGPSRSVSITTLVALFGLLVLSFGLRFGIITETLVGLLVSVLILLIVSRLNLGLTLNGFGSAILCAIVIAVGAGVINWLLALLGFNMGGNLLGAIVLLINAAVVLMLCDKFLPRDRSQKLRQGDRRGDRHRGRELDHHLAARPPRHSDLRPLGWKPPLRRCAGRRSSHLPRAASSQNVAFIRDTLIRMEPPNAQGAQCPGRWLCADLPLI